jgi:D-alanyl-D-alanine dipeptidase
MDGTILMSDPRIASVAIEERGEPLADLLHAPALRVDDRRADATSAYAHVRASLVQMLLDAQARLPTDLHLLIIEGYRPPSLQRLYFERHRDELRGAHPRWTDHDVYVAASRYVSPPEVAPHSCGAAVDVTLCTPLGAELDLGTAVNASPETSENACYMDAPGLEPEARHNRTVLAHAMAGVGFTNYPTEWWHWSYGDRYWAYMTGQPAAIYGRIAESSLKRSLGRSLGRSSRQGGGEWS